MEKVKTTDGEEVRCGEAHMEAEEYGQRMGNDTGFQGVEGGRTMEADFGGLTASDVTSAQMENVSEVGRLLSDPNIIPVPPISDSQQCRSEQIVLESTTPFKEENGLKVSYDIHTPPNTTIDDQLVADDNGGAKTLSEHQCLPVLDVRCPVTELTADLTCQQGAGESTPFPSGSSDDHPAKEERTIPVSPPLSRTGLLWEDIESEASFPHTTKIKETMTDGEEMGCDEAHMEAEDDGQRIGNETGLQVVEGGRTKKAYFGGLTASDVSSAQIENASEVGRLLSDPKTIPVPSFLDSQLYGLESEHIVLDNMTPFKEMGLNSSYVTQNPPHPIVHDQLVADGNGQAMTLSENQCLPVLDVRCPVTELTADLTCQQGARESTPLPSGSSNDHPERRSTILVSPPLSRTGLLGEEIKSEASFPHTTKIKEKMTDGEKEECGAAHMEALVYGQRIGHETRLQNEDEGRTKEPDSGGLTTSDETSTLAEKVSEVGRLPSDPEIVSVPSISDSQQCGSELEQMKWSCALQSKEENGLKVSYDMHTPPDTTVDDQLEADGNGGAKTLSEHQCLPVLDVRCPVTEFTADMSYQKRAGERIPFSSGRSDDHLAKEESTITLSPPFCRTGLSSEDMESEVDCPDGEEVGYGEACMEAEEYGQRMGNETGFQEVEGDRTKEADVGSLTPSDVASAQTENVSEVGKQFSDPNIIPVPPISNSQGCGSESEQIALDTTIPFKEENGLKLSSHMHTPPNTTVDDHLDADGNRGAMALSENQCLPVLDVRCPVTELTADLTCQQGAGESTPFPSGTSNDHPAKEESTITVSSLLCRTGLSSEDMESEADCPHTTKIKENMTDGEEEECSVAPMEALVYGQRKGNETRLQNEEGGRTTEADVGGLTASDITSAQTKNVSEVGRLFSDPNIIPVLPISNSQGCGSESGQIALETTVPFKEENGLKVSYACMHTPPDTVVHTLVAGGNGGAMASNENQCLPVLDLRCPVTELTADLTCQKGARERTYFPSVSSDDHLAKEESTITVSPPLCRTGLMLEDSKTEADLPHRIPLPGKYVVDMGMEDKAEMSVALRQTKTHVSTLMHTSIGLVDAENKIEVVPHVNFQTSELKCLESMVSSLSQSKLDESLRNCHDFARIPPKRKHRKTDVSPLTVMKGQLSLEPEIKRHPKKGRKMSAMPAVTASSPQKWDAGTSSNCELNNPYSLNGATEQLHMGIFKQSKNKRKNLKMNQEMRTKSVDMDKVDATTNPEQCKTVLDSNAPQSQPSKKCQKKNKKGISSLLKTEVSGGGGQAGDSIDIKPEDKSGQLDNSLKNLMEGRAVAGVPDSCTGRQTAEISYQAKTDSVFLETAIPSVVKPVGNVTETTVKHAVMIEGVEDEKKLIDSLPNNSNLAESFEVLNNSTGIDQKVKRKSKKKREAVRKKAWTAQTKLEVHESIELGEIPISGIGDKLDIHGQCKNETEMRIAQQVSIARDKEEDGKNTSPVCLRENENILSPENIYDHNSQIPKTMKGSKTKRLTLLPPETHLRSHSSTCIDISLDIPPVSETPLHQSPTVLTVYNEFEASHFIKQKPCRKRRAQKSKRKSQVVGSQETCIIIHEEKGGAKGSSTAVTSDASPQNDTVFHNKKKRGNPRKKVINEETNDMQQDQQTVSQVISNSFEQQSQNVSRMVLVLPPEVKNESEGEFPTSTTKKNVRKPKKQKLISRVSPLELVESKEHCADVKIPEPTNSLLTPGPGGGKTNGTFTQVDKEAQGNVKKDMKEQKEEMIAVTSVKEEHVGAEERLDVLDVPVRKLKKKLGRPYKKKRLVKMAKPLKFAEEQRSDERDTSALTELRNDCLPQEVIHHIPQRYKVRKISKKVKQALNPPVTNMKRYSRACKLTMVEKTEEYFAHEHDQLTLLVGSTDPLHVQRGRISSSAAGLSVPEASNKIDAFKYLDQKPRRQRKRPKNRMESQAKDGGQEALLAFHEAGVEAKSAMPDNLVFIKEKRGYPRKKVLKEGITCIQNNAQTIPKVPGNPEQQSDNVSQFPNVSSSEIKTDLEGPSILSLKKKLKKPKKQKCTSINFPKELIASTENKMDMMILDTTNSLIIPQKADCKMMSSLPQVNKSEHWNHENMKGVKDDIETSGTIMKSKRKNSRLCKKKAQNIEIAKKLAMEQSSNSVDLTAENQLEKSFPLDIPSQQVKKCKMKKESKKVKLGSFTPVTQLRKNTQACKINSIDEKEDHCAQNPERILIATSGSTSPLNFLNGEISPSSAVSVVSNKACDFHEPKPLRRERAPKKERTPPKRKAKGPVGNKQILSVHEHEVGASPVSGTTGTSELVPNSFLTHNSPKCHHPLKKVLKEETAIQENMPKSVSGNLFEQQTCNGPAQGLVPPSEIKNDSPETFETSVLSMKKKIKKHRIQKPNCKISPEVMFDNTEHSAEMCQGVANDILIPQQSGCEAFGTVKRVVKGIHRNIKKRKAARKKIIKPPSTLKEPKTTGDVFAIHGGAVTKVKRSRPPTPIAQLRRYSRACKVTTDYTFDKIKDRLEYNLKLSSSTYVKQEILGSLEPKITSETIVQFASANASDVQSLSQEHINIKTLESNTVLNSIEHAKVHEDTTTFDTLLSLDTGTTPLFQEIVELNSRDLITKKPRKKIGLKKGRKRRKTWWDDRGKAKRLLGATLGTALETQKLRDLEVGKEKDIAHVCSQIDDVLPNSCSSVGDTGTIDELLPQKPEKETEKETTMLLSQVKSAVLPREQQSITGDHIKQGKLVEIKPIQGLEADPQPTVGLLGHMQGTCKKSKLQSVITEPRVLRDRTPGRIKQGAYRAKVRPVEISQSDCGVSHTTLESKMEGAPKLEVISTESESSAWRKDPKEVLTTKNDSSNTLVNHSDKAGSQVFAKMEEQSILIKDLQRDKLHIEMKDTLLPEACSSKSSSVVSQDILIPQQSGCETFGMVTRVIKGAQRNMKKRKTVKAAMIKPTSNLGEPRKEKDILAILQTNGAITKVKRKRGRPYKKITLRKMAKQLAFIEEQRLKGSKEVAAVNQINNHSTPQEISGKKDKLASPPTPVVHARRSSRTCKVTTDNSFNKIKDHSENNQNFTSSKYVSDTLLYFPGKGVKQEIIQSVETEKTLETVIQFASVDTVPSEVQNHSHEHSNIKAPESSTLLNYEEDSKLREDTTAFTTSISLGTGMTQSFQEIDELNSIELVTKKPRKTVGSKKKGKKRRRTWWDDRGKAKGLQNATTGTVLKTYQDEGRLQPALGEKMPDEENYNSDTKLLIHGQRIHEKCSDSDITEAQLCDFHSEKADGEIAMGQSPLANGENDVQHAPEDLEATINVNCKSQETNDLEEGKEQDIACVYSQHSEVLPNSCSSVGDTGTINAILPEKSEKEAKEEITILLSQDESAVLSRKQQNTTEYNLNLTSSKYVSDILPSFPGMEDKQEIIGSVGTETENISETIINFASVNTAPSDVQSLSQEHSNIKNPESSTVLNLLEDAKVHEHTTSFNTSLSLDTGKAMSLLEIVELNSIKLVTKKPRKTIGSRKRGKKRKRTWWDERGKANKLLKATRGTVLKTSQDERRLQPALEGKIPEEQNYNSCTKLLICGQRIHEQYSDSDISEAQLDDFHSEKTEWKISVGQGPLADGENDVQHTHEDLEATTKMNCNNQESMDLEIGKEQDSQHSEVLPNSCSSVGDTGTIHAILPEKSEKEAKEETITLLSQVESADLSREQVNTTEYNLNLTSPTYVSDILLSFPQMEDKQEIIGSAETEKTSETFVHFDSANMPPSEVQSLSREHSNIKTTSLQEIVELNSIKLVTKKPRKTIGSRKRGKKRKRTWWDERGKANKLLKATLGSVLKKSQNADGLTNSYSTVEDTGTNEVLSQKPEKETKEEPTTLLSQVESAVHSREQQNSTEDEVQGAKLEKIKPTEGLEADPQPNIGPLGHMQGTCKKTKRQKKSYIREPRVLRDRTRDRTKQDACGTNLTLVEMSQSNCEVPHTSLESIKDGVAGKLEIEVISTQSKSSAQGKAPEQKLSAKKYSSEALLNHSHMEDLQVFGKVEEQSTLIKDGQRSKLGTANSENDLQRASEDLEATTMMSCKSHGSKDVEVGKEQDIAHVYSHNVEVLPNSRSTVEDTGTNEVLSQKPEKETKEEPTTLLSQVESAIHSREQQNTTEDQVQMAKLDPQTTLGPLGHMQGTCKTTKRQKKSDIREPRVLRDRTRDRIKQDACGTNMTLVEMSQSSCEVPHTSLESIKDGAAGKLEIAVISTQSKSSAQGKAPEQKLSAKTYSSEALLNHSHMEDLQVFGKVEEQSTLIKDGQRSKLGTANSENDLQRASEDLEATTMMSCKSHGSKDVEVGKEQDIAHVYSHNVDVLPNSRSTVEDTGTNEVLSQKPEKETKEEPTTLLSQVESAVHSREQQNTTEDQVQMAKLDPQTTLGPLGHMQGTCKTTERQKKSDIREPRVLRDRTRDRIKQDACGTNMTLVEMSQSSCEVPHTSLESIKDGAAGKLEIAVISTQSKSSAQGKAPEQKLSAKTYSSEALLNHSHMEDLQVFGKVEEQSTLIKDGQRSELGIANSENDLQHASEEDLEVTTKMSCKSHGSKDVEVGKEQDIAHVYSHNAEVLPNSRSTVEDTGTNEVLSQKPEKETKDEPTTLLSQLESAVHSREQQNTTEDQVKEGKLEKVKPIEDLEADPQPNKRRKLSVTTEPRVLRDRTRGRIKEDAHGANLTLVEISQSNCEVSHTSLESTEEEAGKLKIVISKDSEDYSSEALLNHSDMEDSWFFAEVEEQSVLIKHVQRVKSKMEMEVTPLSEACSSQSSFSKLVVSEDQQIGDEEQLEDADNGNRNNQDNQERDTVEKVTDDSNLTANPSEILVSACLPKKDKCPAKCHFCGRSFRHITAYIIHRRIHTGEKPYSCQECGKTFAQRSHLNVHKKVHKLPGQFQCPLCTSRFSLRDKLLSHFLTHTNYLNRNTLVGESTNDSAQIKAKINARIYSSSFSLQDGKPFKCINCEKQFRYSVTLKRHTCVQKGDKHFSCKVCDKAFNKVYKLSDHEKIHWPVKPFACSVCGKAFSQLGALKTHSRTHTGEKPFTCPHCGDAFLQLKSLRTHQASKLCLSKGMGEDGNNGCMEDFVECLEGQETPTEFQCQVCSKSYDIQSDYNRHLLTHTDVQTSVCDACGKQLNNSSDHNAHLQICCRFNGTESQNTFLSDVYDTSQLQHNQPAQSPDHLQTLPLNNQQSKCTGPSVNTMHGSVTQPEYSSTVADQLKICESSSTDSRLVSTSTNGSIGSCCELFKSPKRIQAHLLSSTSHYSYTCGRCGKALTNWNKYWLHQRVHCQKPGGFCCPQCSQHFRFHGLYKEHMLEHAKQNPYACPVCPIAFADKESLMDHQGKEHKVCDTHKCRTCGKGFIHLRNLERHSLRHRGANPRRHSLGNRSGVLQCPLTTDSHCHPLPDVPAEAVSLNRCGECDANFTTLDMLAIHRLCHSTGDRNPQDGEIVAGSLAPEHQLQARSTPSPTPVLSSSPLVSPVEHESLYAYQHPEDLYVYRTPSTSFPPPVLPYITNVFCYRGPSKMNTSNTKPPALLNTFDSNRLPVIKKHVLSDHLYAAPPRACLAPSSSDSPSASLSAPGGKHPPPPRISKPLQLSSSSLSLQSSWAQASPNAQINTIQFRSNGDSWVDFSSLPLSYVKLKNKEETQDSLECAECETQFGAVSELYEHYIQHARGEV